MKKNTHRGTTEKVTDVTYQAPWLGRNIFPILLIALAASFAFAATAILGYLS